MNNNHQKNIVLDLDGTLLDSRRRHTIVLSDCINKINGENSTYRDFDDFISYKSEGHTSLSYLQKKGICNIKEIFSLWIKKIEEKEYLKNDELYPDVLEYLNILKKQYNLFLVTARSNEKNTFWQISYLNLDKCFTEFFVVPNIGNIGDNKYTAVKSLDIDYVIGDTETDYDFAKRFDCTFFPVNYGFRSATFWKQHVEKSYENMREIYLQLTKFNNNNE